MLCCGRTLIRKTSLLRKIEPIARRSSFANRIIYNSLQPHGISERRNDLEIVMARAILTARPNSDRSPLYDVRKPATLVTRTRMRSDVFADDIQVKGRQQPVYALTSFDASTFATSGLAEP